MTRRKQVVCMCSTGYDMYMEIEQVKYATHQGISFHDIHDKGSLTTCS